MKNVWSIMCAKSSVDGNTNSLSLFNTLEEMVISYGEDINMKDKKIVPAVLEIISLWFDDDTKDDRRFDMLIEFYDPNDELMGQFSKDCIIEKNKKRLRTITKIDGLTLTMGGVYRVAIKYKKKKDLWIQVSDIPFDVRFVKKPIKAKD